MTEEEFYQQFDADPQYAELKGSDGPLSAADRETKLREWAVNAVETQARADERADHEGRRPSAAMLQKLRDGTATGPQTQRAVAWLFKQLRQD